MFLIQGDFPLCFPHSGIYAYVHSKTFIATPTFKKAWTPSERLGNRGPALSESCTLLWSKPLQVLWPHGDPREIVAGERR